jgi:hypothetical protein
LEIILARRNRKIAVAFVGCPRAYDIAGHDSIGYELGGQRRWKQGRSGTAPPVDRLGDHPENARRIMAFEVGEEAPAQRSVGDWREPLRRSSARRLE